MIVVRVEMHSAVTSEVRELGRVEISNDVATGTDEIGFYNVEVRSDESTKVHRGRVEGYARKTRSIWSLVQLALSSALDDQLPIELLTKKLATVRGRSSIFMAEIRRAGVNIDVQTHATLNDEVLSRVTVLQALTLALRTGLDYYQVGLDEELKR
jgi:hypothetical protein